MFSHTVHLLRSTFDIKFVPVSGTFNNNYKNSGKQYS